MIDPKEVFGAIAPVLSNGHGIVTKFTDNVSRASVDILSVVDAPRSNVTSYSTLTMSQFRNPIQTVDGRYGIRIELVAACESDFATLPNALASCAFQLASGGRRVVPNTIVKDAISANDSTVAMKHLLLADVFLWKVPTLYFSEPDVLVAWLQAIPISESELKFAREQGSSALTEALERTQIDVFNINRPSAV